MSEQASVCITQSNFLTAPETRNIVISTEAGVFITIGADGTIKLSEAAEDMVLKNPDLAVRTFIKTLEKVAGTPIDERPRVQELLEANTRYLLRARKAEELISKLYGALPKGTLLAREVNLHMKEPWK